MKRKYFLRGLGAGIVLSAAVMGVTSSKVDLTDAEIRKKALELGMVDKPDALDSVLKESKAPETTPEATIEATEDHSQTAEPTDIPTLVPESTPKKVNTNIKPVATEKPTVTSVPKATKKVIATSKPTNKTKVPQKEIVKVSILAGMWSDEIAQKFKELGLVDDAKAFDDFLCDNDYASLIHVGEYNIPKGSTYEEIAKIITN